MAPKSATPEGYALEPYQRPPYDDEAWDIFGLIGARGTGKTATGAHAVIDHLRKMGSRSRVGIGAPTRGDVRDTCAEGETGLITLFGGEFTSYNRTNLEARHVDGGYVKFQGAEKPERWNGPQWSLIWFDEWGLCNLESWEMADIGNRLGEHPIAIITGTPKRERPKNLKAIKELLKQAEAEGSNVRVRRAKTSDNPHLAERVQHRLYDKYAGTTKGRQELEGEILEEVEGALWQAGWIDDSRVSTLPMTTIHNNGDSERVPSLARVVVAIDPAGTANDKSDETGIVVAGRGKVACRACQAKGYRTDFYVIAAEGVKMSPHGWASRAAALYDEHGADRIIAERNNGGDMVESTIRNVRDRLPITTIHASRGKEVRAEPIAALYQQGRVHHVGLFEDLEEQQCTFPVAHEDDDILDAGVYAVTELAEDRRFRAL